MILFLKKLYNYFATESIVSKQQAFFSFLILYFIFFWQIASGAGQYWDWSFPYFQDHIQNFFWNKAYSWNAIDFGKPLGYASDYFFRFIISLFNFLQPETLRYVVISLLFTAASYGVFIIVIKRTSSIIAVLIALAALINPLIFYKMIAGHINYLASYTIFIYFIHFLQNKFDFSVRHFLIAGLFLSFIGMQIQFFVFAGFIFIFFLTFHLKKWPIRYILLTLAIPLLINSFWISNFFISSGLEQISNEAASVSFKESSELEILNIFTLSFSKATLITKYFNSTELIFNIFLFAFLLILSLKSKNNYPHILFLWCSLIFFFIFATGFFFSFNVKLISLFYPMFREVGHFGPLIFLFTLILIASLQKVNSKIITISFILYLIFFLILNTSKFQNYLPLINFNEIRSQFLPFKQISFGGNNKQYRVLTYPFFSQYSFNNLSITENDGFRLNNTGHDSFATYSLQNAIDNAIPPHKFKNSLQYKLLKTYDINTLSQYNIKYIYDFSNIYESNYEKYVTKKTYDNNLKLIKNDPLFFDKLISYNPGRIKKINEYVYEIIGYSPRIFTFNTLTTFESSIETSKKDEFINSNSDNQYYIDSSKISDVLNPGEVFNLFENISSEDVKNNFMLTYYLRKNKTFLYHFNNSTISTSTNSILISPKLDTVTKLTRTEIPLNGEVNFYYENGTTTKNSIINPSFENGSWQTVVGDCNNYDDAGNLHMKLDVNTKTDGKQSLALEATNHIACVNQKDIPVTSGKKYLFSFDFQSPNGKEASYYMSFNDENKTVISERIPINDTEWKTFTKTIDIPIVATKATLHIYSYSKDGVEEIVTRYDNFNLLELPENIFDYWLVSKQPELLIDPKEVNFEIINPTKMLVHIKGATAPFYLGMSESYHPDWRLIFNNQKIQDPLSSWWPWAKPDLIASENHFELNGFLNGWYVDINEYCKVSSLCKENLDGSYDMELVIEFWPQRWFYIGLIISGTTFMLCIGYLVYDFMRRRKFLSKSTANE